MKPKCPKCAGPHLETECISVNDEALKCVNCGENHLASDKACPKRAEFVKIRQQASARGQPNRSNRYKAPVVDEENFPELPPRRGVPNLKPLPLNQPGPKNQRKPAAADEPNEPKASSSKSNPPGLGNIGNTTKQQPEPEGNLYTSEQLLVIYDDMVTKFRRCRTSADQIYLLGKFIIQYGC